MRASKSSSPQSASGKERTMFKVTIEVSTVGQLEPAQFIKVFEQTFDTLALPKVIAFLNAPTRKPRAKTQKVL